MKKKFSDFKVLYKYLLSYIVVLLIPLLIMSFIIYNYYADTIKEEIIHNNINELSKVKNNIDLQISELNQISIQLYTSEKFLPYYIFADQLNKIDIRNTLAKYAITNDLLHEIVFYMHGEEMMYSSASSYSLKSFFGYIYNYKNWTISDFLATSKSINKQFFRPAEDLSLSKENTERFITYIVPFPQNTIEAYGTILYIIKEKSLINLIANSYNNFNSSTFILDNDNNIITAVDNNIISKLDFSKYIKQNTSDNQSYDKVIIDGEQYLLTYVKSDINDWKYITIVPSKEVMAKLNNINTTYIYGSILIILLGGLVIYILMIYNYNPIKNLRELTKKNWTGKEDYNNEFEMISSAIINLASRRNMLEKKINSSKDAVKSFLLQGLLKGRFKNIKEFNKKGSEVGIGFSKSLYKVTILSVYRRTKTLPDNTQKLLIGEIEEKLTDEIEIYGIDSVHNNQIITIMATEDINDSLIEAQLNYLKEYLIAKYKLQVTIGVGNSYQQLSSIGKSYIEASTAIDYQLIQGVGKVIFFSNISQNPYIEYYSKEKLESLELAILEGNTTKITDIIADIISEIKSNNLPIFIARGLCFDIINVVMKSIYEIKEKGIIQDDYLDVTTLTEFKTIEELAEIVEVFSFEICNYLKTHKENNDSYLMTDIYQYINDNFHRCDFSVQEMADYFEMSQSNLSHYFKEQTGDTTTNYVSNLRIERAKSLLINNSEPIKDIVRQIGYYDPSSFTKKFKQIVGITPGNYRKLHR